MELYLVMDYECEDRVPVGIFDSLLKAEQFIEKAKTSDSRWWDLVVEDPFILNEPITYEKRQ